MSIYYKFYAQIGRCSKEVVIDVLDWAELSQTEWEALPEGKQTEQLQAIYDEIAPDLMVSGWFEVDDLQVQEFISKAQKKGA